MMQINRVFVKHFLNSTSRFLCTSNSSTGDILVEDVNSFMLIGLNNPTKRNALNLEMIDQLRNALVKFENDDKLKVGVLYGVGSSFCSGFDMKEIAELSNQQLKSFRQPIFPCSRNKPILAAVEGYAVGAGLALALECDLRIISENAFFGVLSRRVGIPMSNGSTSKLPKLIGFSRAMDMILMGRCIEAKIAFEWGLANRVVPIGAALGQAVSIANSLCSLPFECIKADRRSAEYSTFEAKDLEDAKNFECQKAEMAWKKEAVDGAKRFITDGIGRHGSFKCSKLE